MVIIDVEQGYVVGGLVQSIIVDADNEDAFWDAFYILYHDHACVGTWLNDGQIHLDAVEIIADEQEALRIGRERGEIAIWDAANAQEITC